MKKLISLLLVVSVFSCSSIPIATAAKDAVPPVVVSSNPSNNAKAVQTDDSITIRFSESISKGKAFSQILLKNSSKKAYSLNTYIKNNILTIKPKQKLTMSTEYALNVPEKAVKDTSGNSSTKTYVLRFVTVGKTAPRLTPKPSPKPIPTTTVHSSDYDVTVPWKLFPNATPCPKDISVQKENAYYVATDGDKDNPGSIDKPWGDISAAVIRLEPGDALYLRGGTYKVPSRIRLAGKNLGNIQKWITISSYEDEKVIIDAHDYDKKSSVDNRFNGDHGGVIDIVNSNYIRVKNIRVQNAHLRGISVGSSSNIEILDNEVHNTYACGIAVWDNTWPPSSKVNAYKNFKITGNKITKANTFDMIPAYMDREKINEPPHEAISIAGATDFEVAFNEVANCDKEGIDVKENSKNGTVHHNYVYNNARQGLYADAWFGTLENVNFYNNIVYNNRGAGLAISVEGEGSYLNKVSFHHNLIYNSYGPGMYISRWGHDLLRENVSIYNNTFVHNGYGGGSGNNNFWINGGMLFHSGNIRNSQVYNNIFSDSDNFDMGFDVEAYGADVEAVKKTLKQKNIEVYNNLFNYTDNTVFPYKVPYAGNVLQYFGTSSVAGNPRFRNAAAFDFRLTEQSPAKDIGCFN